MSNLAKFQTSRTDGRSDAQVIIDLVKDGEPGRIYNYDELIAALEVNAPKSYDIPAARSAIYRSRKRLLEEHAIALQNITNVGFRFAPAAAHQMIAKLRKCRADRQMKEGLRVLQNVRWNEMDSATREAHEGQLLVMSALWANQKALEARQASTEKVLRRLMGDGWLANSEEAAAG